MRTTPTVMLRWIELLAPTFFRARRGLIRGESLRHRSRRRSRWLLFWMAVATVGVAMRWIGALAGPVRR